MNKIDLGPGEVVTRDGQVLDAEEVAYSYTREGRHKIGVEYPNPTPMEPPIGFVPYEPIHEQIRRMVLRELHSQAGEEEYDTPEEADDFEIGDDYDPQSPWEEQFEPTMPWPAPPEARQQAAEQGGGGTQSPSGEPTSEAPKADATPAKPTT